jgi:predicted nucleic acid-binding protein
MTASCYRRRTPEERFDFPHQAGHDRALVKRYVSEPGSHDLIALTAAAEVVATSLVTRAEVAAALAGAVRVGALDNDSGRRAQRRFSHEWPNLAKVPITEALVSRAETLAWDHGLRGYDAVHLAAASRGVTRLAGT